MRIKETQKHLTRLTVLLLMALAAASQALPGCQDSCGSVSSIPYPFGIGNSSVTGHNCFQEKELELTCRNSTLYRGQGNVQIINISLAGKIDMLMFISKVCKIESLGGVQTQGSRSILRTPAFTISSEDNKFVSVGCDTYGYLNSFRNGTTSSTGCLIHLSTFRSVHVTNTIAIVKNIVEKLLALLNVSVLTDSSEMGQEKVEDATQSSRMIHLTKSSLSGGSKASDVRHVLRKP
ncbi:hypothetical protein ACSQ67_000624 [Phaseolus vulgaris]